MDTRGLLDKKSLMMNLKWLNTETAELTELTRLSIGVRYEQGLKD